MTAPGIPWDDNAFRVAIQETLDAFIDEQAARLGPLGPDAGRLLAEARSAATGGKRFRAAFCYWGYRAVQDPGGHEPALLRAAAALELLHASALVHDDYMDSSDVRRGRPASHRSFETTHRDNAWDGHPEQYGAAGAILLGDLLLSWSDQLLRTCGLGPDVVRDALEFFDAARTEVITGQFLDVSSQARGDSDPETAMRVLRYKSAKYSIERPLHIGATLAGAGAELRSALTDFGLPLGEAFQLRDDLLGVFGDPEVTGKPAGDDLREGKRTVLVALSLSTAAAPEASLLEGALGRTRSPSLSGSEVGLLQRVITDSGAPAAVEKLIAELTDRSLEALGTAPVTEPARAVLGELASAATQRVL